MTKPNYLRQLTLRGVLRAAVIAMIAIQVAITIIFLASGEVNPAAEAFPLAVWMTLSVYLEGRVHKLQQQNESMLKQNESLEAFLLNGDGQPEEN